MYFLVALNINIYRFLVLSGRLVDDQEDEQDVMYEYTDRQVAIAMGEGGEVCRYLR